MNIQFFIRRIMPSLLFMSSSLASAATIVFETPFSTNDFRSVHLDYNQTDLEPLRGNYLVRMTYEVATAAGNTYTRSVEEERNCSDSANGHCSINQYLTVRTEIPVSILKELIRERDGEVMDSATNDYIITLRGRSRISFADPDPSLPNRLMFHRIRSASNPEKKDHLVLNFGDFYLTDELGGSTHNNLVNDSQYSILTELVNVRYDASLPRIRSTGGITFKTTSQGNTIALYAEKPDGDNTATSGWQRPVFYSRFGRLLSEPGFH